ncbi:MAG TPA: hypothetical protein VFP33_10545, partial [Gallionella sp.]|nr:hypothetical protein [Gallionella sp.]
MKERGFRAPFFWVVSALSRADFAYDESFSVTSSGNATMRRFVFAFCSLLVVAVAFLAYQRGLTGPFLFDDGPNIVHNGRVAIHEIDLHALKQAAFSGSSGPLMRPLSMMSFAANYSATGLEPYYFKLTNLAIHMFNGMGLFVLTSLLLNFYRKRFASDLPVNYLP